jgi:hypothetical protein
MIILIDEIKRKGLPSVVAFVGDNQIGEMDALDTKTKQNSNAKYFSSKSIICGCFVGEKLVTASNKMLAPIFGIR